MQNPLKKKSGKLFTGISVASVVAITAALIIPTLTASAVNVPANTAGGTSISSSAVTTQSTANSETENENSVEEATTIDASQVKLTEAQAVSIAQTANPNATITCDKLGSENGTTVYELTATAADGTKTEVNVDANTGVILAASDNEKDEEQNDAAEASGQTSEKNDFASEASEDASLASQVKVTQAQAIATVQAAYPVATVTCTELGNENGTPVYELKVTASNGTDSEVHVDANTGSILHDTGEVE